MSLSLLAQGTSKLKSDQALINPSYSYKTFGNSASGKPNEVLVIYQNLGKYIGYNPNNDNLPKFWSCPHFGHANFLAGLVGAQTKHTL